MLAIRVGGTFGSRLSDRETSDWPRNGQEVRMGVGTESGVSASIGSG